MTDLKRTVKCENFKWEIWQAYNKHSSRPFIFGEVNIAAVIDSGYKLLQEKHNNPVKKKAVAIDRPVDVENWKVIKYATCDVTVTHDESAVVGLVEMK